MCNSYQEKLCHRSILVPGLTQIRPNYLKNVLSLNSIGGVVALISHVFFSFVLTFLHRA